MFSSLLDFIGGGGFSKVYTWPNNITVQVGPEDKRSPESDYWTESNTGTFAEGDQAALGHTVKWDLPANAEQMIDLHNQYRTADNLGQTVLMRYQRETASYSCQRMTSEEHYSGGQSQLKDYFQDQLRNGQVLLITQTRTKTLEDGSTQQYIEVNPKLDDNGAIIRGSNEDLKRFGLTPSFVSVDYVNYDNLIDEKLQQKIEYAAEEANSKQELIAAQQKAQTAKMKGLEKIKNTRATEEAAKLEAVIRAERATAVATEEAKQAIQDALKIEARAKAEAYKAKALVAAGLSPKERAEYEMKTAIGVAEALAKTKYPAMIVTGGGEGGANPMQAVGLKYLIDLQKQTTK